MGQLMNIVGPLLLLGGAVFVVAKRCELLDMCGETPADSGTVDTTEMTGDEILDQVDAGNITPVPGGTKTGGTKGCCECSMQGDRVKCRRNGGAWFNPPAGPGGSNDQSVDLSLEECNKGCGSSSSTSKSSSGSTTGAGARASGSASIPKKPRLSASGSVGSGAGAGGTRKSSSSSKTTTKRPPGGAVVNAGASFYGYYKPVYRSYFVDPYNPRPFRLFHRIAN